MARSIEVFAVEDTSAQLTWRGLNAGILLLEVEPASGTSAPAGAQGGATGAGPGARTGHPIWPGAKIEVTAGQPGAAVLDGLPSGSRLVITASGEPLDQPVRLDVTTLETLPGDELCRVATINDLHLGAEAFGHRNSIVERPPPEVAHPLRCARAAIDAATRWGAERLIVKGDITHHGQVEQWRDYAGLVATSSIPVDALPGNHDRAFDPSQGLHPEEAAAVFGLSMASPVMVRDLPGLRMVLADSTTDHYNRGQVSRIAEPVLDAVNDADPAGFVLVAIHHQLHRHLQAEGWPVGIGHWESVRFLDALAATGRRVMVTSGHTHRHRRWDRAGVTATQVGSTKDYPGVWAGYVVHEGGIRQVVHRVDRPDCLAWTDQTRRAAFGAWRWVAPGTLQLRCFNRTWDT